MNTPNKEQQYNKVEIRALKWQLKGKLQQKTFAFKYINNHQVNPSQILPIYKHKLAIRHYLLAKDYTENLKHAFSLVKELKCTSHSLTHTQKNIQKALLSNRGEPPLPTMICYNAKDTRDKFSSSQKY